jgi:hypothetical protein
VERTEAVAAGASEAWARGSRLGQDARLSFVWAWRLARGGGAVAGHVGEVDLGAVAGEQEAGAEVVVGGHRNTDGRAEAIAAEGGVEDEGVAFGDDQVGEVEAGEGQPSTGPSGARISS